MLIFNLPDIYSIYKRNVNTLISSLVSTKERTKRGSAWIL